MVFKADYFPGHCRNDFKEIIIPINYIADSYRMDAYTGGTWWSF
jgi:hypothetical protein